MIPEWYITLQAAERLERKTQDPIASQKLHAVCVQMRQTRLALGKQHPMDQTQAYFRLKTVYDMFAHAPA